MRSLLDDSGVKGRSMCAVGERCHISPGSGNAMETVMSSGHIISINLTDITAFYTALNASRVSPFLVGSIIY